MDPDALLADLRQRSGKLLAEVEADETGDGPPLDRAEVAELADGFRELDVWLSKGGFLPEDWRATRDEEKGPAAAPRG